MKNEYRLLIFVLKSFPVKWVAFFLIYSILYMLFQVKKQTSATLQLPYIDWFFVLTTSIYLQLEQ